MARLLKILIIIVIAAALVGSSAYVFLLKPSDDGGGGGDGTTPDTVPPAINSTTGDTTGTPGHSTEITAQYWDNKGVTSAVLSYRKAGDSTWTNVSLLPSGSASIPIPVGDTANYEFYITVDDAAGNGPVGEPSADGSTFFTVTVHQQNVTVAHTVFIEEGTATWCTNCPVIAEMLHDLEANSSLPFYYVSLIEDYQQEAKDRLEKDYNIYGYPTLFIDGGFNVLVGASQSKENVTRAITQAQQRDVAPLVLTVSAIYDNHSNQTNTTVEITNYDTAPYAGTLRVYLAERNSVAYSGGQGNYHHGFLHFIGNENVNIPAGQILTKLYSFSTTGLDAENLEIFAAVFNQTGVLKHANPDQKNNSFTAYYADACNHTVLVSGGNLPPSVGITSPTPYSWNFFNHHILPKHHFKGIICFGRPTITAKATDDSGIAWVVFYLDGKLVKNLTTAPYEWKWTLSHPALGLRQHNVTVIAYDTGGKSAKDSILLRVIGF